MMSSTFGAPLGGTTVGGHHGFESFASSFITPPNFGGGGGSCFPSMVVVALGEPGTPVVSTARAGTDARSAAPFRASTAGTSDPVFMLILLSWSCLRCLLFLEPQSAGKNREKRTAPI